MTEGTHIGEGRRSVWTRLRNAFIAGVVVVSPIALTVWLVTLVVGFVDENVLPLLGERYHPANYLPFAVPGIGVVIFAVVITFIGWVATGLVGRTVVRLGERLLDRMPVIRSIYSAFKQIFEAVFSQSSRAFRDVVLIPYPRPGSWAIGFATGTTRGEVQKAIAGDAPDDEVVNVFVPTTPNPTSGFLLFLPKKDVIFLDMSVEQGIKLVISGGVVTPDPPEPVNGGAAQPERSRRTAASRSNR